MSTNEPEAWLRGPLEGVLPLLQPAAHALVQAAIDIERAVSDMTVEELWGRPAAGSAASIGFHLRHIAGSIDRLLTYARNEQLSDEQMRALKEEATPGDPPPEASILVAEAAAAINEALNRIKATSNDELLEPRAVGRARLPSNVIGLLFHIAEHTARHTGQITTLTKVGRRKAKGES